MTAMLEAALWPSPRHRTFVALDAAANDGLLAQLYSDEMAGRFACLFPGEIAPDLAYVAPYLAVLEPRSRFARWVLSGWGRHWGVALVGDAGLALGTLAMHLRRFNLVVAPGAHAPAYFRYYDPRVLRAHCRSAPPAEVRALFGPLERIVVEGQGDAEFELLLPPAGAA